jgi:hypothetical protein
MLLATSRLERMEDEARGGREQQRWKERKWEWEMRRKRRGEKWTFSIE